MARLIALAHKLRSATSSGFLAKAARLASGHATGYAVTFALSPVLARIYGPEAFGLYALFVLALSTLGPVATLRFDQAIPLAAGRRAAGVLASLALVATMGMAIVGLLLAELVSAALGRWGIGVGDAVLLPLVAVGVLCFSLYQIVAGLLLGDGMYRELARMRVVYALISAAAHLTIPFAIGSTKLGLPAGQAIGFAAAAIYGCFQLRQQGVVRLPIATRTFKRFALRYQKFAVFGVPAAVVANLGLHAPALLLALLFGLEAAGVFALAQRVFTTPLTLVTNSFSRTFLAEARESRQSGRLEELFRSAIKGACLLTAPPIALVAVVAPWAFGPVLGADWTAAGWVCALLAPMVLAYVLAQVVGPTFDITGQQAVRLRQESLCTMLVCLGITGAFLMGLPYLVSIAGGAVGGTLGYALLVASAARYARQEASPATQHAPVGKAA